MNKFQVDFYLLSTTSEEQQNVFICKLAEKILRQSLKVIIFSQKSEQVSLLDQLLYEFRPDSFLPHTKVIKINSLNQALDQFPIVISLVKPALSTPAVVINLSEDIYLDAERVIEIVNNSDTSKQASRKKYMAYRQAGRTLKTHQM